MQNKSKPLLIFYLLVAYVIAQFIWWSFHMISLNNEIYDLKNQLLLHTPGTENIISKKAVLDKKLHSRKLMIAGESLVFLVFVLIGIFKIRKTFNKEVALSKQQKNFLLSITHELKSPVASAKLQLQTLLKRDLDKEKQNLIIEDAINDIDRLNNLVENILIAANINNTSFSLYKEKINLTEYITSLVEKHIDTFEPSHKIENNFESNIHLEVDKQSITAIVLNLLENAIKYSPQKSKIKLSLKQENSIVKFSVEDEGPGISDEEKKNIFNQFYRIGNEETRRTKGTGLGLYIVKYLVEKNNGEILVKNNLPKGAIFEIIFYTNEK